MRIFHNMSYRFRMLLVFGITILLVVTIVTLAMTLTSSHHVSEHMKAHLELLTEQSLMNFENETSSIARQFVNQLINKQVASSMYDMRSMQPQDDGYWQKSRVLSDAVNQLLTAQTGYDSVYVRLSNGLSFSNVFADAAFVNSADALLSQNYGAKTYGNPVWTRTGNGEIYLIRDVYNLSPFMHVGKAVARIRESELADLGTRNDELQCAVAFFTRDGKLIAMGGVVQEGMQTIAEHAFAQTSLAAANHSNTLISTSQGEDWIAVGMMPEASLRSMQQTVLLTALGIAVLSIALGSLAVLVATRRMTSQIKTLVRSMDEVTAGNLELTVPVERGDEIGQLSVHFNTMIHQTRELLTRVVDEESRKNKAEYAMLEYKYRSLQSQINPHFIYNALEVVNAMGKLSKNDEICEVVRHISAFFRQNARNMQKRFVTVQEELDSLKQYAYIYCHIYGSILSVPFSMEHGTEYALIPTMILQPVLENALVHGIRSEKAIVEVKAHQSKDGRLCIRIRDNGTGMPPEKVNLILKADAGMPIGEEQNSAGVGMRNVRDRLQLIYGSRMQLAIDSRMGEGTEVSITIPLVYQEEELLNDPSVPLDF